MHTKGQCIAPIEKMGWLSASELRSFYLSNGELMVMGVGEPIFRQIFTPHHHAFQYFQYKEFIE